MDCRRGCFLGKHKILQPESRRAFFFIWLVFLRMMTYLAKLDMRIVVWRFVTLCFKGVMLCIYIFRLDSNRIAHRSHCRPISGPIKNCPPNLPVRRSTTTISDRPPLGSGNPFSYGHFITILFFPQDFFSLQSRHPQLVICHINSFHIFIFQQFSHFRWCAVIQESIGFHTIFRHIFLHHLTSAAMVVRLI